MATTKTPTKASPTAKKPAAKKPALSSTSADATGTFAYVPYTDLVQDPHNVRLTIDQAGVDDLAESIAEFGLMQPLVVKPAEDGKKWFIVAGNRRYMAVGKLVKAKRWSGLVPAVQRVSIEESAKVLLQLMENLRRVDLAPLDVAAALSQLVATHKMPIAALAKHLNRPETYVKDRMALLLLSPKMQTRVNAGTIALSAAVALARAPETVRKAFENYPDHMMHVDRVRNAISQHKADQTMREGLAVVRQFFPTAKQETWFSGHTMVELARIEVASLKKLAAELAVVALTYPAPEIFVFNVSPGGGRWTLRVAGRLTKNATEAKVSKVRELAKKLAAVDPDASEETRSVVAKWLLAVQDAELAWSDGPGSTKLRRQQLFEDLLVRDGLTPSERKVCFQMLAAGASLDAYWLGGSVKPMLKAAVPMIESPTESYPKLVSLLNAYGESRVLAGLIALAPEAFGRALPVPAVPLELPLFPADVSGPLAQCARFTGEQWVYGFLNDLDAELHPAEDDDEDDADVQVQPCACGEPESPGEHYDDACVPDGAEQF